MPLDDILIKKEEIPIYEVVTGTGPKPHFQLPIHPIFASDKVKGYLDKKLAKKLFPTIIDDWYAELKSYANGLDEGDTKEWFNDVFLKEKPHVKKEYGQQYISSHRTWNDDVGFLDNGFTFYFSLERNTAGSIGVHNGDFQGAKTHIGPKHVRFSTGKFAEYDCRRDLDKKITEEQIEESKDGSQAYVFMHHNVELYASALFLRNWAMEYENESLKSLRKSGII